MFYSTQLTKAIQPIIVLFFLVVSFNANAQQFQKSYGGSSEEYIYSTEQLSDGGYILCGRTITGTMNSSWDAYVVRLNSAGDTLWTKNYGNVGYDEFQSVKPTQDGGFIFCGQTDNVDAFSDVYLVKTDALGVVTWSKAYGGAGTSDFGFSVRQTTDLGYIVAGMTQSAGAGGRDVVLIKTTSTGTVTWSKTYGGASDDEGRCVEETSDGYVVAGVTSSYGNGIQAYVVKTNATGVVTWSKTFGGSNTEYALSIKQTTDNGYVVAGYTDSYGAGNYDALLLKLTSAGALSWAKTYGGTDIDIATSIKIISDGYVLAGRTTSFGAGAGDYYLIKTDASGVHTWSKAYGGSTLDQAYNVSQTTDGGFVLTGYANSYGAGSKDGYLIKTDASGVSTCHEVVATTTTNSPTVTNGTGATEGTGISAANNPTTARRKTTMTIGTQCFVAGNSCPVNASFTSSATSICPGTTVTFTNTTTGGAIGQGWYENNVLFSVSQSTQRIFNTAGTYTIQLIATNGTCQDTATAIITVNPTVTPSVSITSLPPSPICAGTSVTFTATPTNGGTPTYQWYNGVTLIPNVSGATYTTTGLTNGSAISVVMTSTATCVSPATATSNTITYTVNPSVTPSVSITSLPPSPICAGTSVTFTATPTNGGSPTYQWYNGANLIPNVSGATYTTTGLTNGSAILVVMTSTAACASPASATSNTITYTVNPPVTPSVSITSNPPSPICAGTSVTFTATPTNGGANPTYQWYNGANLIPNVSGATYTTTGLTNGAAISVVMTSNAACPSPATATSNSIAYTVLAAPVASFTPSATTICAGASVTFTNTTTGAIGQAWYENNILFSTAVSPTRTFNTAGSYLMQLTSTNGTCQDTATATITVNPIVTPLVSITSNPPSPICAGTSVTFTATPTNGGTPTYQWYNGANLIPNVSGATYTTTGLTNGAAISVVMTSTATCASPATATSNTITYVVNSLPVPIITHTGNSSVCQGDSILLTASAGSSWTWLPGGETTQSIYAHATGNYSVTITNQFNCSATSDTTSLYFIQPTATITPTGSLTFCQGNSVILNANGGSAWLWAPTNETTQSITVTTGGNYSVTVTNANNCVATSGTTTVTVYPTPATPVITLNNGVLQSNMPTGNKWYMTGGPNVLGTNQTYTPTVDGYYSLSYTDANGCTSLFDSIYVDVTGITENLQNRSVVIYPNPANDVITVSNYKHVGSIYSLFDGLGRVVLSGNFTAENTNINIGNLTPGMYILTINGSMRQSYKVMKQ